jgi:hypothetical protein
MYSTRTTGFLPVLCMLLALLVPLGAKAQPEQGSALTIAGSVLHFGYQEFNDTGKLLDREDGFLPGLVLGLSHTADRWLFAGDFAVYGGEVVYTGLTNTGIPISTRTEQHIADLALRSEYWQENDKGVSYAFYAGAGYHHWDRDIKPTITATGIPVSGLFETYRWWSAFLGAKASFYKSASVVWLLDARVLQIISPTLNTDYNGQYDNVTLQLGERLGVRLALPLSYTMNQTSSLIVEPYAESYELGRSARSPLNSNGTASGRTIWEPLSQTINYGLTVGVSQRF